LHLNHKYLEILKIREFIYIIGFIVAIGANALLGQNQSNLLNNNFSLFSEEYVDIAGMSSMISDKILNHPELSNALMPDTLKRIDFRDSTIKEGTKFEMKKSPTKAVILSLLMPGLGQIYVESYWKSPIFFVGAASLAYLVFWNNSNYLDAAAEADKITNSTSYEKLYWINHREYYHDNRDQSAFFLIGVYILAAVDAYSDAHLFDFDVSQKFSLNTEVDQFSGMILNLSYKW
jgi:hypothetical protein